MKKLILIIATALLLPSLVSAQVKDLKLDIKRLEALTQSVKVIHNISNPSPKQIDSVTALYPPLNVLNNKDLSTLHAFMVPQLIPGIKTNRIYFEKCAPFARKYVDKMAEAAPSIVEKYPNTTEQYLMNNLNVFFQMYLYLGLSKNNKLEELNKISANEISSESLDKLFILARGSEADDMIYFTMAHSFTNLYELISKEYKIPNINYSKN